MLIEQFSLRLKTLAILLPILLPILFGCNSTMITHHSKLEQQQAKPSTNLLECMLEFREIHTYWPQTKEEFTSSNSNYKKSMSDFPYLDTRFKIINQDKMTFYFNQHIKDVENYKQKKKVDLNAFGGEVKFYKENGKFIWKIKMY